MVLLKSAIALRARLWHGDASRSPVHLQRAGGRKEVLLQGLLVLGGCWGGGDLLCCDVAHTRLCLISIAFPCCLSWPPSWTPFSSPSPVPCCTWLAEPGSGGAVVTPMLHMGLGSITESPNHRITQCFRLEGALKAI